VKNRIRLRSKLFVVVAAVFLSAAADAQQAKLPRIGYVSSNSASAPGPLVEAFTQGLRDVGYVDGKNAVFEYRFAEGVESRIPELVNDLVKLNVDVIVAPTLETARAVKRSTTTIPCLMIISDDPVSAGLVASLARPGGNLTGFTRLQRQLSGKRLELLTETVLHMARVAVLHDPGSRTAANGMKEYNSAAQSLKVQLFPTEVHGPSPDLERVFQKVAAKRATGVVTITTQVLFRRQKEIAALAARYRLPSMFEGDTWVEAGGLMSYSTDDREVFHRAAGYVDKIIKGAKPADLPVEQPTKFELVINLKTAKQIGLTIPPNVLARADRVIK
jgi:putative tryptophan/tyrosine transport system substrate-binding protein